MAQGTPWRVVAKLPERELGSGRSDRSVSALLQADSRSSTRSLTVLLMVFGWSDDGWVICKVSARALQTPQSHETPPAPTDARIASSAAQCFASARALWAQTLGSHVFGMHHALHRCMETSTQNNQKTLSKARREAATTHVEKGLHSLRKGVTRFVSRNRRVVSGVTLGAVGLIATGRLAQHRRSSARLFPSIAARIATSKLPLRKAFRSYRRTAARSTALSNGALVSAGALIGTGLTMLLAPRFFAGK
jgi:hypothetical protein